MQGEKAAAWKAKTSAKNSKPSCRQIEITFGSLNFVEPEHQCSLLQRRAGHVCLASVSLRNHPPRNGGMVQPLPPLYSVSRDLITYVACGAVAVLTDFIIYIGMLKLGAGYELAYPVGYLSGTGLSFVLNRAITFRVYDATLARMFLFFGVAFVGYCVSYGVLFLLIEIVHFGPVSAKVCTLAVVLVIQFSLNRAVTFRGGPPLTIKN